MQNTPLLKDLFYTFKGILLYKYFLKNSCYWEEAKMKQYQFRKLKKLLIEAGENTNYYNKLFKSLNFNPLTDFNNIDDIKKLPILSKSTYKDNPDNFINPQYLQKSLLFKTSGSTGNPMYIHVYENQWILEQGVVWRHWKWGGYNFRDKLAMVRSFVPNSGEKLWKKNILNNFIYFSPFHLNDNNISLYLKEMINSNIKVLRGYPSSILAIANYVLRTNHPIPKIKLILTASEVLTDIDRDTIEKAFKVNVSNHYGLAEQIVMMGDCERHEGLHNYDEYGYLELLDTDDPQIKRIIGTNLHNLTTPLIRYDTGDLAIVSDKPCSCGRTLPTIKNIIGRNDAVIKTVEGYEIPTTNFYTMLEHFQEIERWQIVQHSLTEVELIFKSDSITNQRIDELKLEIKSRLNNNISIILSHNGSFIQKNEGKINPFVSHL